METGFEDKGMITDKSLLEGSCYIEVLPGTYQGECWNDGSVFFTEETFGFIEAMIESEVPTYDHYAFNVMARQEWERILKRLDMLEVLLQERPDMRTIKEHVHFFYGNTEEEFCKSYDDHIVWLVDLLYEFRTWLWAQLEIHEYISVLGI